MLSNFVQHTYQEVEILQSTEDITLSNGLLIPKGYVNATQILKAASKEVNLRTGKCSKKNWSNYIKKDVTKDFLVELASVSNTLTGIQELDAIINNPKTSYDVSTKPQEFQPLIIVNKGGIDDEQGTFVHIEVAIHLAQWCSPKMVVWSSKVLRHVINGEFLALTPEAKKAEEKLKEVWEKVRASSKFTRHTLTDAIKEYVLRHDGELSANYTKFVYLNTTDKMYKAVFGMTAIKLEKFLNCDRHQARNHLSDKSLKLIDFVEESICKQIDKRDIEPSKAVDMVIDFNVLEPIKPVAK